MIQKNGKTYYTIDEANTYLDASIERHADEMISNIKNKQNDIYA